jgi:hypothetical protein
MEGLTRMVTESLARHGMTTQVDYRRLQWSRWLRCQSSLSLVLAPAKPGLYALGEEVLAEGEVSAIGGKRMLAVFQIAEAADLGFAMGKLFSASHPLRERLAEGRCFVRYAVVEDADQRRAACLALQQWLAQTADASGMQAEFPAQASATAPAQEVSQQAPSNDDAEMQPEKIMAPEPLPSGF